METHSLATLKTGSHLSGNASLSFGYLTEKEDYVLMVNSKAVARSPFLMFFSQLDLVYRSIFNYIIC